MENDIWMFNDVTFSFEMLQIRLPYSLSRGWAFLLLSNSFCRNNGPDSDICDGNQIEYGRNLVVEKPPENCSYIPPNVQLPGIKWLDNHRPVFTVTIDAVTSLHTLNPSLNRFINLCEYLESRTIPPRIEELNIEREMEKALLEIQQSELEPLVKNLFVILDKLVELLVTMYKMFSQCLRLGPIAFEALCLVTNKFGKLKNK